jgi:opacity protein-like surface antigen
MTWFRLAVCVTLLAVLVRPASGQTDRGAFAGITASAITIEDGTNAAIAATMGYRFTPIVSLGMELTFVPSLDTDFPDVPIPLASRDFGIGFPYGVTFDDSDGHATIFTTNLRLTVPTASPRIAPYLVGGAGVATITEEIDYAITYPPIILAQIAPTIFPPPVFAPIRQSISVTRSDFAVTIGGGVSMRGTERWWFDVEARYFGVMGDRDIQSGRYGGGVTFRF